MPGIDYRQLRQQVSMAQVLALLGFQATCRRGDQLRGPCLIPGCRSTSPRAFSVHLTRQVYRCFVCGSHGNSLDLWAAPRRLPLHSAPLPPPRSLPAPGACPAAAATLPSHLVSPPVLPRCISRPIAQPLNWPPSPVKVAPFLAEINTFALRLLKNRPVAR